MRASYTGAHVEVPSSDAFVCATRFRSATSAFSISGRTDAARGLPFIGRRAAC